MSYFSIFLAFLIALVAIVSASNALDRQHALSVASQMHYMQPAESLARAAVQQSIADQVQVNPGAQITALSIASTYQSICGSLRSLQSAPCPQYLAIAKIEGATGAGGSGSGTDACSNANDGSELQETCLSILLTITLANAHGSPIGTRSEEITYRTFNAIPYAVIAGVDNLTGGVSVGEANASGCDPATPVTCSASPPPLLETDTRLHSYDQCQPGLTLCIDPATGQPYVPRESSSWNTQGYTDGNQAAGTWQK